MEGLEERLSAPGSLTSWLDPRLPPPNPSHFSSAETLKCHPMRKLGGLSLEELQGLFQLLEVLQSCQSQTTEIKGETWVFSRQELPTQGNCCLLSPTGAARRTALS